MNFQINRVLTYDGQAGRLEYIRVIAAKNHDFDSWHSEWLGLAQTAEAEKRYLYAAYGYRIAEFFLTQDKPEKAARYEDFMRCFYQAMNPHEFEWHEVPYEKKFLPAMRCWLAKKTSTTESECGEQHCQVGNHQLAIEEITRWLDTFRK